jgi:hypothetical protein
VTTAKDQKASEVVEEAYVDLLDLGCGDPLEDQLGNPVAFRHCTLLSGCIVAQSTVPS